MTEDRLLKINDCLKIIPIARSTWWEKVKAGKLPAPVKIGTSTFWRHSGPDGLHSWHASQ